MKDKEQKIMEYFNELEKISARMDYLISEANELNCKINRRSKEIEELLK